MVVVDGSQPGKGLHPPPILHPNLTGPKGPTQGGGELGEGVVPPLPLCFQKSWCTAYNLITRDLHVPVGNGDPIERDSRYQLLWKGGWGVYNKAQATHR